MPRITVGIPAYKPTFLVQAIASVFGQTWTDFELLVSDDSPDRAVSELVSRFRDPRIRLIEGPRRGLVANSVHVWEHAGTELLKFLYDDDVLAPTALAELTELIDRDPRYVYAFSRRDVIDAYGRVIRRPEGFAGDDVVWFDPPAIAQFMMRTLRNPVGEPSSMLIRRSAFPDSSCLSQFAGLPIRHLIDVGFMMNAAQVGPSIATPSYLASFRQHEAQVSSQSRAPGFVRGVADWEICLRGAVQGGLVAPHTALLGVPHLEKLYKQYGRAFGETRMFLRDLTALSDLLGAGEREVMTETFREHLHAADVLAAARAADPTAPVAQPVVEAPDVDGGIRARIDHLSRRQARGWAIDPAIPDRPVRVEALLGDRVIGHAVADVERPDLSDWNLGHIRFGFEMAFYEPLLGEDAPRFRFGPATETWLEPTHKLAPLKGSAIPAGKGAEVVLAEHATFTQPGPLFEETDGSVLAGRPAPGAAAEPLLVAFYLPQFHATPENDRFWGRGFTEWRQVSRAAPRFPGHYQPRIPRDLGFYDLLDEDVIRRQADLAKGAGIGAFGFYYYWFDGKRVLDRPIELFLHSDIEMPFLVIWANENWTRTWDGGDHEVLLKQTYDEAHEDALLADLARHMRDPRYVRLDGRPLFVIYNPDPIPKSRETVARWRRKWRETFGLDPLVFMAQTFDRDDPRPYDLDGALEFPPHKLASQLRGREVMEAFASNFSAIVIDYDRFAQVSLEERPPSYPLVKTVTPSWDNDARRPGRGLIVEGSTPEKYRHWLQQLIERAIDIPVFGTPVVAINAWNEWAEGAYLEPDVHYGSAYLNATGRALKGALLAKAAPPQATTVLPERARIRPCGPAQDRDDQHPGLTDRAS